MIEAGAVMAAKTAGEIKIQSELQQVLQQESFRLGEANGREISNPEVLKQRETEAASEIRDFLDNNPEQEIDRKSNWTEEGELSSYPKETETLSTDNYGETREAKGARDALNPSEETTYTAPDQARQEYLKEVGEKSAGGEVRPFEQSDLKKLTPEECKSQRQEFKNQRNNIINNWEKESGMSWPCYKEDVFSQQGKRIARKGDSYEAHHVQPLGLDGKNESSNITPMHYTDHRGHDGIHRYDSPYSKLVNQFK